MYALWIHCLGTLTWCHGGAAGGGAVQQSHSPAQLGDGRSYAVDDLACPCLLCAAVQGGYTDKALSYLP